MWYLSLIVEVTIRAATGRGPWIGGAIARLQWCREAVEIGRWGEAVATHRAEQVEVLGCKRLGAGIAIVAHLGGNSMVRATSVGRIPAYYRASGR